MSLDASLLTKRAIGKTISLAVMYRHPAAEVGEAERGSPVAAVYRPEKRKQRLILRNGQELPITLGPPTWSKVESNHHDLANQRVRAVSRRKDALQSNYEIDSQKWLHVVFRLRLSCDPAVAFGF